LVADRTSLVADLDHRTSCFLETYSVDWSFLALYFSLAELNFLL
jgi:hypothetical protein